MWTQADTDWAMCLVLAYSVIAGVMLAETLRTLAQ